MVDAETADKSGQNLPKKNIYRGLHTKNISALTTNEQSIISAAHNKNKSMLSFSNMVSEHKEEEEASSNISMKKL